MTDEQPAKLRPMTCYDGTTCRFGDEIDQLRSCLDMAARRADNAESALAAMTARAEQAEADERVLRTLVNTASIYDSVRVVLAPGENRTLGAIMNSHVAMLFEAAADNGAFANDHCDPAAVARVAKALGVALDDAQEAQP